MVTRLSLYMFLSLAVCSVTTGCGSADGPELANVSGVVTLDGQPLENAQVTFQPEHGRPSSGMTNREGKYQIQYTSDRPGAMIGSHKVLITTAIDLPDDTRAPERVPAKYNTNSELVREVQSGTNTFDFELSS